MNTLNGNYTPDWAVLLGEDGENKMYFIVETKGTTNLEDLRQNEKDKIKCGKKHFKAIVKDVQFEITNDCNDFILKADEEKFITKKIIMRICSLFFLQLKFYLKFS